MVEQYGYGPEEPGGGESRKGTYILLGIVAIIFIVIFINFFSKAPSPANRSDGDHREPPELPVTEEKCGDTVCDSGEGCFSCPADCVCSSGRFCNIDSDRCEEPLFDVEAIIKREYGDTSYKLLSQFESDGREIIYVIIGGEPFIIREDGKIEPYPNI
jgi:hypothetical protein